MRLRPKGRELTIAASATALRIPLPATRTAVGKCVVCPFQVLVSLSDEADGTNAPRYAKLVLQAHLDERHPALNLVVVG